MDTIKSLHHTLKLAKYLVYDKYGLEITNHQLSLESNAYGACSFLLNGKSIQYRIANITPKKIGQFVSIWKRNKIGITEPYDISDDIDFIIITVINEFKLGQFIFPVSVLTANGIITKNGKEGKRGIRVYPPWDNPTNIQAKKTQQWQIKYFIELENNNVNHFDWIHELFDDKI